MVSKPKEKHRENFSNTIVQKLSISNIEINSTFHNLVDEYND